MKRAILGILGVLAVTACCHHKGTLKATRGDFVQLRKELKAGELKVVKYKDATKNKIATEDWIDVTDAAISNIDKALGADTAPVTGDSR